MTAFAIVADRVFDGAQIRERHAVLVDGGQVADVIAADAVPRGIEVRDVKGLLASGFIDIQVNGGGGVLFNDSPTVEGIRTIGAAHRKFGTTGFLPTLITDTREKMAAAIEAARQGLAAGIPGLLGVHLEGPCISVDYKGAHNPHHVRAMDGDDVRLMTSLKAGRTFVTLSPEEKIVRMDQVAALAKAGVVIAAGHTGADYETLMEARRNGVKAYTHLFNAMPDLKKREPGPVGAALDDKDAWCSIIADLHHVSAPALRLAIRAKGADKVILITDAMSPTGTDAKSFDLTGQTVYRRNGRLEFSNGTLAGADLDMASAVKNAYAHLGVDLASVLRMASLVPAAFLGLDNEVGKIAPGYRANLVLLDESLNITSTWIDGVEETVNA
jgi:N-acetylglucosamine-6-phosphate deacetylase